MATSDATYQNFLLVNDIAINASILTNCSGSEHHLLFHFSTIISQVPKLPVIGRRDAQEYNTQDAKLLDVCITRYTKEQWSLVC